MDLYHMTDKGEVLNLSKSVRDMNEKILRAMQRAVQKRPYASLIKVDDETWVINYPEVTP